MATKNSKSTRAATAATVALTASEPTAEVTVIETPTVSPLASMTIEEITAFLEQRKTAELATLTAQRTEYLTAILAVDARFAALNGTPVTPVTPATSAPTGAKRGRKPGSKNAIKAPATPATPATPAKRGPGRPRKEATVAPTNRAHNDVPLNQVVHTILSILPEKTSTVKELEDLVKVTDYKTNSENLYAMIHTALKDETLFAKVSRGVYRAL